MRRMDQYIGIEYIVLLHHLSILSKFMVYPDTYGISTRGYLIILTTTYQKKERCI